MAKMKTIVISTILLGVAIQFIPYGRDHTNPKVVQEPKWDSPQTRTLFMRACADCHSNETKWKWYSNVAPISWLVQSDVEDGREHLNISNWRHQRHNHGDESSAQVRSGHMPPLIYTAVHPDARLSKKEKKEFIKGLINTFGEENDE